jgi:VanZ family protein
MHPVKTCSEKDGPQRAFEVRLNKVHNFFSYWFPILLYCLLIFIQSSYPSPKIEPNLPNFDKVLHFMGYALLGALFLRAFYSTSINRRLKLIFMLSILLSGLYGISDEIHQYFVPSRSADVMDVAADFVGAAWGVFLYMCFSIKHAARSPR